MYGIVKVVKRCLSCAGFVDMKVAEEGSMCVNSLTSVVYVPYAL